jgi:hypothetical protein
MCRLLTSVLIHHGLLNQNIPQKRPSRLRSYLTTARGDSGCGSCTRERSAIRRLQTHRGTAPTLRIRVRDGLGEVPPVTVEVHCVVLALSVLVILWLR